MVCDICVCHSTTLVARWSSKVTNQLTASLTRRVDSWLSAMRHPCPSLHAQHVPWSNCLLQLRRSQTCHWYLFIKPVNFSNSKLYFLARHLLMNNSVILLSNSALTNTSSWVSFSSPICDHTSLRGYGVYLKFFSLTFSFRQQIVIVKYSFWVPLSLDACCIPPVSILLTSSLHQQCVTMWPGLPQLYSVRIKDLGFYFIFFHFSFIFSYFFYWRVEDKEDKVWHCHRTRDTVTEVTHSHDTRE